MINFFFNDPTTPGIYTLSLHDALPISRAAHVSSIIGANMPLQVYTCSGIFARSEEHTSELQSRFDLVCRLLLEKKKKRCLDSREATLAQLYGISGELQCSSISQ